MELADRGVPPASTAEFIEDMLNQLAEMADRLGDEDLASSIRSAGSIAARKNTVTGRKNGEGSRP
jgi:hypothetical protein